MTLTGLLVAAGVPSAITGLLVWRLKKQIDRTTEQQRQHEAARLRYENFQASMLTAVSVLCEANAIALQNGKCNGETHAALEYLNEVKRAQRQFLTEQGLEHIYHCNQ